MSITGGEDALVDWPAYRKSKERAIIAIIFLRHKLAAAILI
jgi:hypothetical protein